MKFHLKKQSQFKKSPQYLGVVVGQFAATRFSAKPCFHLMKWTNQKTVLLKLFFLFMITLYPFGLELEYLLSSSSQD